MQWKGIVGRGFTAEEFAAYVQTVALQSWRPQFVVVHNTGSPRLDQWHSVSGADRMQNLQHYYRDVQKWSGGPHLFVADDLIWVFTPLNVPGVHSPSWNEISLGMEMVGDYSAEAFDPRVKANAIAALTALHERFGLNVKLLRFHNEDPLTTHKDCPGKNVSKPEVVSELVAALQSRSSTVPQVA
jgi:hypothetical protein